MKAFYKILLSSLIVLLSAGFALTQQSERDKGIELYKQGKNKEAVVALERASKQLKIDAEVQNYLGLAYLKNNELKKAIKMFGAAVALEERNATYETNLAYAYLLAGKTDKAQDESTKAVALNPQKADAYYVRGAASLSEGKTDAAVKDAEQAIKINPDYAVAYTLKSDALLTKFGKTIHTKSDETLNYLTQSKEALENCLKNCRSNAEAKTQTERLDAVKAFYDYYIKRKDEDLDEATAIPAAPNPNFKPLKLIKKPFASYTDAARAAQVNGTITVLVLFAASGRVTHTIILQGLGYGLNENAVRAAQAIQFEPAEENGKPVSKIRIVQYSFKIGP